MAEVNELVTAYSVVLDDKTLTVLTNLQTSFERINDVASDFGKIFTGGMDITSFFKQFVSGANDLENLAKATGYSTDALQEWSYAAKASGVSADAVLNDMKNLKASYAIGEKDLLRLSKTFSKSSAFYSQQLGQYLGMSQDMINLLKQGPEAVQNLLDEAHKMGTVIPKEEIEKAAKAQREFNKSMAAFQGNAQQVVAQILPTLNKWLEKLNKYMGEHPEETLNAIGRAIKFAFAVKTITTVMDLTNKVLQFNRTLVDTNTAIDTMIAKEGAIGKLGQTFKGLGMAIKMISFVGLAEGLSELLDVITDGKWSEALGNFWGDFFYDPSRTFNDRMFKGLNWIGEKTGWWEQRDNPYSFNKIGNRFQPSGQLPSLPVAPTPAPVTNNSNSQQNVNNNNTIIYNVAGDMGFTPVPNMNVNQ